VISIVQNSCSQSLKRNAVVVRWLSRRWLILVPLAIADAGVAIFASFMLVAALLAWFVGEHVPGIVLALARVEMSPALVAVEAQLVERSRLLTAGVAVVALLLSVGDAGDEVGLRVVRVLCRLDEGYALLPKTLESDPGLLIDEMLEVGWDWGGRTRFPIEGLTRTGGLASGASESVVVLERLIEVSLKV
jgi:hypothetical protein